MKGENIAKNRSSRQIFADFSSKPVSSRRAKEEGMLLDAYRTNSKKINKMKMENEGLGLMGQLFNATS